MATNQQRNVLFLIADDWSRLAACYGNPVVQTPHIDAFAQESIVFDQAFCTSPFCAVSRACIADPNLASTVENRRQQLYTFRRRTADPWLEVDFQAGRIADLP